ncbi:TPA: Asp-tRNA(Asn)/Glu-tRNA(Gln) amidotransferase subunit GatA, partial [Candidatus Peregrinibacteria bacterium]|nr:Asp-tRNA(Asn)/Glu-tRNA(Gln) amidotransferase subunit GatA [Candidatus Peregrinibacteria bacterium]
MTKIISVPTTIAAAQKMLKNKEITALELTNLFIKRIEKFDDVLGSYLETSFDLARESAKKLDESGDFSAPLAGIPYSLKDVISKKGLKNTAGSKILENYVSPYDATVTELLEKSGAILLGKVNTDEFTQGSSCENSALKLTKNPWNIAKVPGGSSGGSAASVAKHLGLFSIGTDTGGSIRQPANFCGVTGLKVSYGRVSRSGIISYASSFDSIGPIAPTVDCVAKVLKVIAGYDKKDSTTLDISVENYSDKINGENALSDLSGKTIGVIKEFTDAEGFDINLKKSFEDTIAKVKELGGKIKIISLPLTKYAIPTYYLLVKAEAS